jgi:hypothetical protein
MPDNDEIARMEPRDAEIQRAREAGQTFKAIGEIHGISRGKVKDVVDKRRRAAARVIAAQGTPRGELSARAYNIVSRHLGIVDWSRNDLQAKDLEEIAKHPSCGRLALTELHAWLSVPADELGVEVEAQIRAIPITGMRP